MSSDSPLTVSNYLTYLRRLMPKLLVISLLAALAALGILRTVAPGHQVHFSYLVSLREREVSPDFRFDGYYALQATDLFAATLAKWVQTPEMIVEAYAAANLTLPTTDPRALTSSIRAEKTAPQLVEITIKNADAAVAEKLARGLQAVVTKNMATYEQTGIPAVHFSAVPTTPWVGTPTLARTSIVLATFVFTFLLSVNIALLWVSSHHLVLNRVTHP